MVGLDDANDLVEMAVMLGRAVPAGKWVDRFVEAGRLDSFKGVM